MYVNVLLCITLCLFQLSGRESWLLCYYCLTRVLLLLMFCGLLTVQWVGLHCVIVVFPDHTHLLFEDETIAYWMC